MIPSTLHPEDVIEKINEIKRYYDACEIQSGGSARISKSMLAFSMGVENITDIEPLLQELHRQGQVAVNGDHVVFTALARVEG